MVGEGLTVRGSYLRGLANAAVLLLVVVLLLSTQSANVFYKDYEK